MKSIIRNPEFVDTQELKQKAVATVEAARRIQHFYRAYSVAVEAARETPTEQWRLQSSAVTAHLADRAFEVERDLWALLASSAAGLNSTLDTGTMACSIESMRKHLEGKPKASLGTVLGAAEAVLRQFLGEEHASTVLRFGEVLDAHDLAVDAVPGAINVSSKWNPEGLVIDGHRRPGSLPRRSPEALFVPVTKGGLISNPIAGGDRPHDRSIDIYDAVFGAMIEARDTHYALARRLDAGQLGERSGNELISAVAAVVLFVIGLTLILVGSVIASVAGCGSPSARPDPVVCAIAGILLAVGFGVATFGCSHYPGCTISAARTTIPAAGGP